MVTDNWLKIPAQEKTAIKTYILTFFEGDQVLSRDKQVVKMLMLLLAKIAKLSWLDDQDIRTGLAP